MTDVQDVEARRNATMALERIEGHEKLCTERWTQAHGLLKKLDQRWWWLLLAIIAGNIGSTMFAEIFTTHPQGRPSVHQTEGVSPGAWMRPGDTSEIERVNDQ